MIKEMIIENLKGFYNGELMKIKVVKNQQDEDTLNVIALVDKEEPQRENSILVDVLNEIEIDDYLFLFPITTNSAQSYDSMEGEEIYDKEGETRGDI